MQSSRLAARHFARLRRHLRRSTGRSIVREGTYSGELVLPRAFRLSLPIALRSSGAERRISLHFYNATYAELIQLQRIGCHVASITPLPPKS